MLGLAKKREKSSAAVFARDCFAGKSFLITGAGSGIGAHAALTLNQFGAKIIAIAKSAAGLEKVRENAAAKERFIPLARDLSDVEGLDKWALEVLKTHGAVNGALLSAGVQQIVALSAPLSIEGGKNLFAINYFGNLAVLKALLDKRAKTPVGASFVWVASNAASKAQKGLSNYAASKAAIIAAIRAIALEIAPRYRINAISPGFTMTRMISDWAGVYDARYIEEIHANYPLGVGFVEDISPLVCFLLSESSGWINAQNIVIDGGGSL